MSRVRGDRGTYTFVAQGGEVVWRVFHRGPLACPRLHAVGARGIVDGGGERNLDQRRDEGQAGEAEDHEARRGLWKKVPDQQT